MKTKQKRCALCLNAFTPGALPVVDMQPEFKHHPLVDAGMCPTCSTKRAGGFIAMIGIDPKKSREMTNNRYVEHDNAYRTGNIGFLKKSAWDQLFDVESPPEGICFVDDDVLEGLNDLIHKHQERKEKNRDST